eukprot:1158139-Pelagomonas_calceolata.AAC.13
MDVDGVYKARCKWCGDVSKCHIGVMFMREVLNSLHRRSKALTPAPAPKANSMSDSSRDSSILDYDCSSASEHEPAWRKQA